MNLIKQQPEYFSAHFNIDKSAMVELGVFDPILNFDTKVFVEPLLLKKSSSPIIKSSYNNYKQFFASLLVLLQKSQTTNDKCWRTAKKMVNFPEYQYTCIGYSYGSVEGRGSGAEFNDKILQSAREIVDLAQGSPEIFLLLPLLEEGIAGDRISDMVQNIIDDDICQYTTEIMAKIGLKGSVRYTSKKFKTYVLPKNPYSKFPVKLIPQDILSNLPVADNVGNLIEDMTAHNARLRNIVNRDIGNIWHDGTKAERKEKLLEEIKTNKEFFVETLKALKEYSFEHYDLEQDYEGLYKWLKNSQAFINVELAKETKNCPDTIEALQFAVTAIIHHFRDTIENNELWRTFWTKYGSDYKHVKVFYSQMLFFAVCNTWLTSQDSNVQLTLRNDKKNMNLDFTISGKHTINVNVKHANNTSLANSYKDVLEKLRGVENKKAIYVIMNFKEEPSKQLSDIKIIENPICKIFEVDVINREASDISWELPSFDFGADFDLGFTEFEGIDFDSTISYTEEKRKGGNARHKETTIIKEQIIKPMFICKRKNNGNIAISAISDHIINELISLEEHEPKSQRIRGFMNKYSIDSYEIIRKAINYLQKHNDGGQIKNWCYQISKNEF